jgi:thioredoxin-like negative regulator of GroEL
MRLLLLLLLTTAGGGAFDGSIRWTRNLKQASELAQAANRPMLIDFWADWCAPCKVMDAEVYTNPALSEAFGQRVVAVRINFDMQPEIARKYNVQTIPHLVFTNSYGTELLRRRGLMDAKDLTAVVNALPADLSELNRLDRALQRNRNDFESLLAMGRHLRAEGFFESSSAFYSRAMKQPEAGRNPGKREFILRELGRDYLALKDARRAAQAFEKCLKDFPNSGDRPNLLLNLAESYILLEEKAKARKALDLLIADYPGSDAARKAQAVVALP